MNSEENSKLVVESLKTEPAVFKAEISVRTPENLLLSSKKLFSESKYPKNSFFEL